MNIFQRDIYEYCTKRPWASTHITIDTGKITPRIKSSVARVLRGEQLPPQSGDTAILSNILRQHFDIPRFAVQARADGVHLSYRDISSDAMAALIPHYNAERVAIRLGGTDHERDYLSFHWSSFHSDIVPNDFHGVFKYTRPHADLLAIRDIALKDHQLAIEKAVAIISGKNIFELTYNLGA